MQLLFGVFLSLHITPDKQLCVRDFREYCEFMVKGVQKQDEDEGRKPNPIIYEKCGDRWEVAVTVAPEQQFQQVGTPISGGGTIL